MTAVPISVATKRYGNAHDLRVTRRTAFCQPLDRFLLALRSLRGSLGESASDSTWRPILAALNRYSFSVCTAPLPFDYLGQQQTGQMVESLARAETLAGQVYPASVGRVRETVDSLRSLVCEGGNPLLEALAGLISVSAKQRHALVLCEPRLVKPSLGIVSRDRRVASVEVVSCGRIQAETLFDSITLVGALRWYPQSVVTSPCAPNIHLLQYHWLADRWKPAPCFMATVADEFEIELDTERVVDLQTSEQRRTLTQKGNRLAGLVDELRPSIDWEAIRNRIRLSGEMATDHFKQDQEDVEAIVVLLEGDYAVPLDADEASRATVLDLTRASGRSLLKLRVSDLEPGMFLLARTSGAGEYVAEVADRELGPQATRCREAQRLWKSRLRQYVRKRGIGETVRDLEHCGAEHANLTNVRNWSSYRTIRPAAYVDFLAVLRCIDLETQAVELWETMSVIDRAHKIAGHRIGKALRAMVEQADLNILEREGRMDFALEAVEGGTLAAFRIVDTNGGRLDLPPHRLGRPVQVGDV